MEQLGDYEELPFCPQHTTGYTYQHLRVTFFEKRFSQSYYHYPSQARRRIGSNACTLIALLVASKVNAEKLQLSIPSKNLNARLIHILAKSMLRGNKLHDDLRERQLLSDPNLTIPEAIHHVAGFVKNLKEWKCQLFRERLSTSLYENIWDAWLQWINSDKKNKDLYVIIVADSRSVLLIMQRKHDTVYLVDSHLHSAIRGAAICAAQCNRLRTLCRWYQELLHVCYQSSPSIYELSFLYFDDN